VDAVPRSCAGKHACMDPGRLTCSHACIVLEQLLPAYCESMFLLLQPVKHTSSCMDACLYVLLLQLLQLQLPE
jgi:hypothetical protein